MRCCGDVEAKGVYDVLIGLLQVRSLSAKST